MVSEAETARPRGVRNFGPSFDRCLIVLTALAIFTDGLVYAAYLFVVAIGLTLIFGVMKILNVTHGSFYAFGAYGAATAVGIYFDKGWPVAGGFLLMVLVAVAIGLVLGTIIERGLLRF